ncbi:MAG: hypothetical protein ACYC0H_18165 [Solirubrobacteraceae bacterium]
MTDTPATPIADSPVAIDRVERVHGDRLRVVGRWLGPGDRDEHDPLLVIERRGTRHRFAPRRPVTHAGVQAGGAWEASFDVPSWIGPELGSAALWIGTALVPLPGPGATQTAGRRAAPPASGGGVAPPPSGAGAASPASGARVAPPPFAQERAPMPPPLGEASAWPQFEQPATALQRTETTATGAFILPARAAATTEAANPPGAADPSTSAGAGAPSAISPQQPLVESGRTGPLAELLFKESVTALHDELEQRAAEEARLRAALATAESQLRARTATQSELESAHGALRHELQELMAAVAAQHQESERRRRELEDELAAAVTERDRALAQLEAERDSALAQLEAERERAHEQLDAERTRASRDLSGALETADREAQEAVRLREQLSAAFSAAERHAGDAAALRERLAAATVARDSALGETAGLRAELERLGAELALAQEQVAAHGGDLGEAQRLLADAKALAAQLRGEREPG